MQVCMIQLRQLIPTILLMDLLRFERERGNMRVWAKLGPIHNKFFIGLREVLECTTENLPLATNRHSGKYKQINGAQIYIRFNCLLI